MTTVDPPPPPPRRRFRRAAAAAWATLNGPRRHLIWSALAIVTIAGAGGCMLLYYQLDVNTRETVRNAVLPGRWPQSSKAQRTAGRLRVLFLGNSFTQYNGGQALILEQLTRSARVSPPPVIDQVVRFGATLRILWEHTAAQQSISAGSWDYVVLQDYSTAAFEYRSEMNEYSRLFANAVRKVGAEPVYFMTWAYMDASDAQPLIERAYSAVARSNHATVCPVGLAWQAALAGRPGLVLHYATDHKHPTPPGSYLTACVFYSLFFHRSPHGLSAHIDDAGTVYVDLSPALAHYLQDVAWDTVRKYKQPATRPATGPSTKPTAKPVHSPLALH